MENTIFKIILYVCLLLFTIYFFKNLKKLQDNKPRIEKTFLIILLSVQVVRHITYIAMGKFTWLLPLHVCNLSAILLIIWLFKKNERLKGPVFLLTFLAAAALVFPAVNYSWRSPLYYTFIIDHIILLFVSFYMIIAYQYKPSLKDVVITTIGLSVLLIIGYYLNGPLKENYFYLQDKPLLKTIKTPTYMVLYMLVVVGCFGLIQTIGHFMLSTKTKIKEPI